MVSADGLTVADTITGLVWQRDGSGARASCSGEGKLRCAWSEAQAYCASLNLDGIARWRLPAWKELLGIADLTADGSASAIDPSAFPNTPAEGFWTSSPFAGSPSSMLYVDFANGSVGNCGDRSLRVRCVRGSTCHPTSRFVVLDDGLVHDTLTGLVWQQKPSVSALDGGPCMYWQEAEYTCASLGAGFRLPTLKEFESLVFPKGTSGPIIDKTAFPVTTLGSERFWTSSPYLGPNAGSTGYPPLNGPDAGSGYARYSAFSPAIFSSCDVSNGRNWGDFSLCFSVRCVR